MKRYLALAVLILAVTFTAAFPAALQIDMLLSQVRTNAGGSLNGGHVHFYSAGTTTNKTVWTDYAKTSAAANPYTLDSNGTALLYGDGLYRIVIHTSAGVTAFDRDNIRYEDISGAVTRITSLTGDGSGSISGFDNLTLTGNIAGDNTGNISGFDNATFTGRTTTATLTVTGVATFTGAPVFTDNTINGADVIDNTVTNAKLLDNTIAAGKIAASGTASNSTYLRGDGAWGTPSITTSTVILSSYKGLVITTPADNQSVTIAADQVVAVDNTNTARILSTVSLTVNLDVAGANGLDTGTITDNTGYYLYVIDNGATTAGLASTSATSPAMPTGYTYKALVGWCTTDNTATPFNIEEFTQIDDVYLWNTKQKVVSAAGNTTTTAINLAAGGALTYAVVPPTITKGIFGRAMNTAGANTVYMNPVTFSNSLALDNGEVEWADLSGSSSQTSFAIRALQESQKVYYQISGTPGENIWISGFTLKR